MPQNPFEDFMRQQQASGNPFEDFVQKEAKPKPVKPTQPKTVQKVPTRGPVRPQGPFGTNPLESMVDTMLAPKPQAPAKPSPLKQGMRVDIERPVTSQPINKLTPGMRVNIGTEPTTRYRDPFNPWDPIKPSAIPDSTSGVSPAIINPKYRTKEEQAAVSLFEKEADKADFQQRLAKRQQEIAAERAAIPGSVGGKIGGVLAGEQGAQKIGQVINRFARGAGSGTKYLLAGMADASNPVAHEAIAKDLKPFDDWLQRTFPTDQGKTDFLTTVLPEGAGTLLPMIAGTVLTRGRSLAGAMIGALMNAGQTYDEARQSGASSDEAVRAARIGLPIGALEALGLGRSLNKFGIRRALTKKFIDVGEETFQEIFTQGLNNVNARLLSGYDSDRALIEGLFEAGLVGGIIASGIQGASVPFERRAQRQSGARAVQAEQPAPLNLRASRPGGTRTSVIPLNPTPEQATQIEGAAEAIQQSAARTAAEAKVDEILALPPEERKAAYDALPEDRLLGNIIEERIRQEVADIQANPSLTAVQKAQRVANLRDTLAAEGIDLPPKVPAQATPMRDRQQAGRPGGPVAPVERPLTPEQQTAEVLNRQLGDEYIQKNEAEWQVGDAKAQLARQREAQRQQSIAQAETLNRQLAQETESEAAQREADDLYNQQRQSATEVGKRADDLANSGQHGEALVELARQRSLLTEAARNLPRNPASAEKKADIQAEITRIKQNEASVKQMQRSKPSNAPTLPLDANEPPQRAASEETQEISPLERSRKNADDARNKIQQHTAKNIEIDGSLYSRAELEDRAKAIESRADRTYSAAEAAMGRNDRKEAERLYDYGDELLRLATAVREGRANPQAPMPKTGGSGAGVDAAPAGVPDNKNAQNQGARTVARYDVATEDAGTLNIRVFRTEDGGITLFDESGNAPPIEYNAEFAKGKSDEEIMHYAYEMFGIGGITVTQETSVSVPKQRKTTTAQESEDRRPPMGLGPERPDAAHMVSLSQYNDLTANNKEAVNNLYNMPIDGDIATRYEEGMAPIREWAAKQGIEQRHVDALEADIKNYHMQRAMYGVDNEAEYFRAGEQAIEIDNATEQAAVNLAPDIATEIERKVASLDALYEDENAIKLVNQARYGNDADLAALIDYAGVEYGIEPRDITETIQAYRGADSERQQRASIRTRRATKGDIQASVDAESFGDIAGSVQDALLTDINDLTPENIDSYLETLEAYRNRSVTQDDIPVDILRALRSRMADVNELRKAMVKDKILGPKFQNRSLKKGDVAQKIERRQAGREKARNRQREVRQREKERGQSPRLLPRQQEAINALAERTTPYPALRFMHKFQLQQVMVDDMVDLGLIKEVEGGVVLARKAAPKAEAAETVAAKEPWQMTQEDARNDYIKVYHGTNAEIDKPKPDSWFTVSRDQAKAHGRHIHEVYIRPVNSVDLRPGAVSQFDVSRGEPDFTIHHKKGFHQDVSYKGTSAAKIYTSDDINTIHKRAVEKALSEGKPVPAEVLADYPDLAPTPAPKAEAAETVAAKANDMFPPRSQMGKRWRAARQASAKAGYPNAVVLLPEGGFVQAFGDDAVKIADRLNLSLTGRVQGGERLLDMTGFPQKEIDSRIAELNKTGIDVAVETGGEMSFHPATQTTAATNQPITQARAKAGGEYGPNGEWYKGGAFIATTEMPKRERAAIKKAASRKVRVEPGESSVPEPGKLSIFDALGEYYNWRDKSLNEQYIKSQDLSDEYVDELQRLQRMYESGERWTNTIEFPNALKYGDIARMLDAGQAIPGAVLDKIPASIRGNIRQSASQPTPDILIKQQPKVEEEPFPQPQKPFNMPSPEPEPETKRKKPEDKASAPPAVRFEAGKALTATQRKEVLRSVRDVYRDNHLEKEMRIDRRGEEYYVYPHTPEMFIQSDITGRMIRHYVTMPDGRRAHPSELFPDLTQAAIDREIQRQEAEEENQRQADEHERQMRLRRIVAPGADQNNAANQRFIETGRGRVPEIMESSYFAQDDQGRVVRVDGSDAADVAFYESEGFRPITKPVKQMRAERKPIMDKIDAGRPVSAAEVAEYPDLAAEARDRGLLREDSESLQMKTPKAPGYRPVNFEEPAPVFYSALERFVADKKFPNKASGAQMLAMIQKPQSGVKPDEVKWLGLEDWLRSKQSVTKDEVLDYIRANEVKVEEVERGGPSGDWVVWDGSEESHFATKPEAVAYAKEIGAPSEDLFFKERTGRDATKYSQYTIPGATEDSYRELLLTMPMPHADTRKQLDALNQRYNVLVGKARAGSLTDADRAEMDSIREKTIAGHAILKNTRDDIYKSSHWSESNVLAHIRYNERTDADGKRVLFVEEIQSDWAQAGRREGFRQRDGLESAEMVAVPMNDGGYYEVSTANGQFITNVTRSDGGTSPEAAIAEARRRLRQEPARTAATGDVPAMPFPKTDSWAMLSFKRMLRHAAENGYDRIAWTTGEQQAERYDLSKQVDAIEWETSDGGKTFSIAAMKTGEMLVHKDKLTPEALEEAIGKDAAQKIIDRANEEAGTLKGVDLKVGGEGMKGFYDAILPAAVNKYLKKWGVKAGETETATAYKAISRMGTEVLYDTESEARQANPSLANIQPVNTSVHSVDITPEMRDSVMQGQPLFVKSKDATSQPATGKSGKTPAFMQVPRVKPSDDARPLTREENQQILTDAGGEFRERRNGQGTLNVNHQAAILVEHLENTLRGETTNSVGGMAGVVIPLDRAQQMVDMIRERAGKWNAAAAKSMNAVADLMETAIADAVANKANSIEVIDATSRMYGGWLDTQKFIRRHEAIHSWQWGVNKNAPGLFLNSEIANDPDFETIRDALGDYYENISNDSLWAEAVAFVASGDWHRAGLNKTQAVDFLDRFFTMVARKYGRNALNGLRLATPETREILENVKRRGSGRDDAGDGRGIATATSERRSSLINIREIKRKVAEERQAARAEGGNRRSAGRSGEGRRAEGGGRRPETAVEIFQRVRAKTPAPKVEVAYKRADARRLEHPTIGTVYRADNQDKVPADKVRVLSIDDKAHIVEKRSLTPDTKARRIRREIVDVLALPRALMASVDASGLLRQGAILALPPTQWGVAGKAIGRMLRSYNTKQYEKITKALHATENAKIAKQFGLYLSTEEGLRKTEEDFISRYSSKIPLVKHSEQAYKMVLDSLRLDTFSKYKAWLDKADLTEEQRENGYKAAAKWINTASGRGSLGDTVDKAMPAFANIFFSPRYVASRIQLLNPYTYLRNAGSKEGRLVLAKQMGDVVQFGGMVAITLGLMHLAGATVNWDDPEDPDFLKGVFGNLRYDVLAGAQQVMRLYYRVGKDVIRALRGMPPEGRQTASDVAMRFLRSKLAPVPSYFVDMITRKDFIGREFSAGRGAVERILPLVWQEFASAWYREGLTRGVAVLIPSIFGIGVQDYERKPNILSVGETSAPLAESLKSLDLKFESVRALPGESPEQLRERSQKINVWMDRYGEALVKNPRFKNLTPEMQKAAIENLRGRVGGEANRKTPRLSRFNAASIIAGTLKGAEQKRKRAKGNIYNPSE